MRMKDAMGLIGLQLAMSGLLDSGRTPTEKALEEVSYSDLIREYNLIQRKESRCSRRERELIVGRVDYLVSKDKLIRLENGDVDKYPTYIVVKK